MQVGDTHAAERAIEPLAPKREPIASALPTPPAPSAPEPGVSVQLDGVLDYLGNDGSFKTVDSLQSSREVNPRNLVLTNDQRRALQAILDKAKVAESAANYNLQLASTDQAKHLIDQGLGWEVPKGKKSGARQPDHDTLWFTSERETTRAISFNSHADPAVAPYWAARKQVITEYSTQIIEFFSALPQ
jgi:hypothetical protein